MCVEQTGVRDQLLRGAITMELPRVAESPIQLDQLGYHPIIHFKPTKERPTDIPYRQIAVVGDNLEAAYVVGLILQRNGLSVVSIAGDQAQSIAFAYFGSLSGKERDGFDLLLIDYVMPDIHGLSLVEVLRERLLRKIPMAIMTDLPFSDVRTRSGTDGRLLEKMRFLRVEAWSKIDFAANPLDTLRSIHDFQIGLPRRQRRVRD